MRSTRPLVPFVLACLVTLWAASHVAAQAPKPTVPAPLTPWVPWVLQGAGEESCPNIEGVRTCLWPSSLELDVGDTGAEFRMSVTSERPLLITLPGSRERWPEDVRVGTKPQVVVEPNGAPQLWVEPGSHAISGRFVWSAMPDTLVVPANLALLRLRVNGASVAHPLREANGLVWLRRAAGAGEGQEERLEVSVHRHLQDGNPLLVRTRLRVAVSGKRREIVFPRVLVPGTRPVALQASLPAQLTKDGSLRLQAEAGTHQIELLAVQPLPAAQLSAPDVPPPWPAQEIWVFSADDRLRHAELHGAPQIDASRTDLDADWASLPAYVLTRGRSLQIETKRRGEPEPPPNQLTLQRSLWLDLDGYGYTIRDNLSGQVQRGFRLDLSQGTLGRAVSDGRDQLVTLLDKKSGVELRRGDLTLQTEWRLDEARAALPAVGYDEDVQQLGASLHLPPGFMLLGGSGVDHLSDTWVDGWNLFDFFFVLLVALAAAKLAGRACFVLALGALVLTHHEPDAPAFAWLCVLAFAALVRVVREGRWAKIVRYGFQLSVLALLLVVVPFATTQIREALYPQLEPTYGVPEAYSDLVVVPQMADQAPTEEAPAAPAAEPDAARQKAAPAPQEAGSPYGADESTGYGRGAGGKSAYDLSSSSTAQLEVDPNQVVQTGPGLPTWSFRSYRLGWSGPVEKSQQIRLYIVPPALSRLWSVLSVLLSIGLLWVIVRATWRPTSAAAGTAGAALLLGLMGALAPSSEARAQDYPPQELLEELRARLTKPAACEPSCVSVPKLQVAVVDNVLRLRAEVHAGAIAAYRAPGPLDSWAPQAIRVDGKEAFSALRVEDGFLLIRVEPGLHTVELSGPMPRSQALTLALGAAPHRVEVDAKGYQVQGLGEDGRVEGSLSLTRELTQSDSGEPDEASQALDTWLAVRRELDLGVRFRVNTLVERVGSANETVIIRLPLLEGESVTEAGFASDKGSVAVELPRGVSQVRFSSVLAARAALTLKAAQPAPRADGSFEQPWSETWVLRPSALYHLSFEGIAPVSHLNAERMLEPVYRPWPGEVLAIKAEKLAAAPGESVTVDQAELELSPGSRIERATLTLSMRTTHGTSERIALPKDAKLTGFTVDGTGRTVRLKDGALELHLDPGSHSVKLWFQRPVGIESPYASPSVHVKRPLTNVTTSVSLPGDRWLLWAAGPSWGPAILFWGYLVIVVLAALGLSRAPLSPLKTREWLLLGLGLTQVEIGIALFVVGWLFALAYRERHSPRQTLWFNLTQVALVLATLLALGFLAHAVHQGLVVQPDMQVVGQGSSNRLLRWYTDRTAGGVPGVQVWSLPLWIYKGLMLLWSLWLAASLLRWLRWGFAAFRSGGSFRAPEPRVASEPTTNPRVPLDQIAQAQAELDAARKQHEHEPGKGNP